MKVVLFTLSSTLHATQGQLARVAYGNRAREEKRQPQLRDLEAAQTSHIFSMNSHGLEESSLAMLDKAGATEEVAAASSLNNGSKTGKGSKKGTCSIPYQVKLYPDQDFPFPETLPPLRATLSCDDTVSDSNTGGPQPQNICYWTYPSPVVWYKLMGIDGTVTVDTCDDATNFDTVLALIKYNEEGLGCGVPLLECVARNDDFCGKQSRVSFIAEEGAEYWVRVQGWENGEGNFTLNVGCTPGITSLAGEQHNNAEQMDEYDQEKMLKLKAKEDEGLGA